MIGLSHNRKKKDMSIKYFTWFMKSRNKVDTVRGIDEHENFKSKQWEDKNGNPCYNFWDILVIQVIVREIIMSDFLKLLICNTS